MVHIKESKGFGVVSKPPILRKQVRLPIIKSVSKLPNELSEMAFAIKDSKKLLDLQEDWDSGSNQKTLHSFLNRGLF